MSGLESTAAQNEWWDFQYVTCWQWSVGIDFESLLEMGSAYVTSGEKTLQ